MNVIEVQRSTACETEIDSGSEPATTNAGDADRDVLRDTDWCLLVQKIQTGDPDGLEHLYKMYGRGIRFHLCRQLGASELDDRVHDTFLVIVQSIREGHLREPERLSGFVRTIVRRQIVGYINVNMNQRKDQVDFDTGIPAPDASSTPEQTIVGRQQRELIRRVLDHMNERDRQILTRFYLYEQPVDDICNDMGLSETQFRLLKSRAKARFGELGKKKLSQQALSSLFVRASVSI